MVGGVLGAILIMAVLLAIAIFIIIIAIKFKKKAAAMPLSNNITENAVYEGTIVTRKLCVYPQHHKLFFTIWDTYAVICA